MKTIIIGGVAGGATAAARLRRLDEKAEIIILERGEYVSFANCGLPYYIGGVITDRGDLTLQTPQSFKARFNIDVRVLNEAVKINPNTKTVTVKNLRTGETYEETYDNLILSMGAEPIRPNIEGADVSNVFTLRNIPDALKIKNYIDTAKPRSAVVIGGGYIGVEMAENLVEAGLNVAVVELADHLIAPLDFDMAADVHRYIKSKGIYLHLNNGVKEINGNTVILQNGEVTADMIIMSVGVRPETAIARDCGIELNPRGSIVVNNKMQTNIPDIYAVGDAVEVEDFITKKPAFIPLAGPANKQGRIAADNIAGYESVYTGTQGSAVLKLFDMTVATTGLNEKSAQATGIDYDKTYTYSASHATYYPGAAQMSLKALWDTVVVGKELEVQNNFSFKLDAKNLYLMRKELIPSAEVQYEEAIKNIIRQKDYTSFWGFKKERCGVPPEQYRRSGRLNTKTDAFLYLAMEERTAVQEMKPILDQEYSIAVGQCVKTLKLVDLVNKKKFRDNPALIYFLSSKISEPNIETDESFYHLTQHLTHKLRVKGFDGILYNSSVRGNGRNVLIFEETNVDFKSSCCKLIESISVKYQSW